MTDRDALADAVTAARFPTVRFRRGYAIADVDDFLTDLATAVRAGAPVRERIDAARFGQSYGGYDMGAVDAVLDQTAAAAEPGIAAPAVIPATAVAGAGEAPSAISTGAGKGTTGIVAALVTIVTFGVVAGIAALVVGNVRPQTSLPVWPTVLAGCGVGLVYELAARVARTRRG